MPAVPLAQARSPTAEKMAQAYDFALDKIGLDYHSFPVWSEYVAFLKAAEAVGSYAENQKISAIRKVYQRGVVTPMNNVEILWKDYMTFENSINPIIAEKMSMEYTRDHINAKRVAREMENEIRGLNRNFPSVPPTGSPEEQKQISAWKKYIAWEKGNPLRTEDMSLWTRRVTYAFEQCLLCLGHHPDVWHEYAVFLQEAAQLMTDKGDVNGAKLISDDIATVFERATQGPMRRCMLIYFAYADFEETRMSNEKVHKIYSSLIDVEDIDPTLGYIQYMKFARRAEGIQSARKVFKKAREDKRSRHHMYVSAALTEYYCSKNKEVAFKVFELGLKKFGDSTQYILCYIDYLSHLNEDNNTRVLFERVLSSGMLDELSSVEVWNRFMEFECNIGDLTSIVKVEKRRTAILHQLREYEGKETALLVDRYRFLDLYPCSRQELRAIGYQPRFSTTSSAAAVGSGAADCVPGDDEKKLPRPDFAQMVPYKPKQYWVPGEHPIPGGGFPLPPAAYALCQMMPPPRCFHGPFVGVDALLAIFEKLELPDSAPEPGGANGQSASQFEMAKSIHWIVDRDSDKRVRKRANDSDDDDMQAPPANDIYRQRQQKRVK
ncbi:protein suppressor of forked-like [Pollicipes pollicipes]|uniref:protein suppressor of forked-like n=1 Tax=Pollicipes pollicipes TaxID=41117 RepID=UPI00188587F3|nr:protein suppressor of forked-like [Pollicipes pollicipes]